MANPDQKTILLEQAYDELKAICTKFQEWPGAIEIEVKTLLRELARTYGSKNFTSRTCEGLWKRYWLKLWHRLGSLNKFNWYSFAIN